MTNLKSLTAGLVIYGIIGIMAFTVALAQPTPLSF